MITCNPPECDCPFYVLLSYRTFECINCHRRVKILSEERITLESCDEIVIDHNTVNDEWVEHLLGRLGYVKKDSGTKGSENLETLQLTHPLIERVYIASSSNFVEDCEELTELLEGTFGLRITRKWWGHYVKDTKDYPTTMPDKEFYVDAQVQLIRELDLKAVRDADLVICLVKDRYKLTGALVEVGYALALNKPVIIFGRAKRSAMLSSCIHVTSWKN